MKFKSRFITSIAGSITNKTFTGFTFLTETFFSVKMTTIDSFSLTLISNKHSIRFTFKTDQSVSIIVLEVSGTTFNVGSEFTSLGVLVKSVVYITFYTLVSVSNLRNLTSSLESVYTGLSARLKNVSTLTLSTGT